MGAGITGPRKAAYARSKADELLLITAICRIAFGVGQAANVGSLTDGLLGYNLLFLHLK